MAGNLLDRQPHGLLRLVLRLPIWFYRLHLGWLLDERFLLLTHTGRKTGLKHQTVLELVKHDKATDTFYVAAGWADKADWFKNIQTNPNVTIEVGNRKRIAFAERISAAEGAQIVRDYARHYPFTFRQLAPFLIGHAHTTIAEDAERLAQKMPLVALHPLITTKREQPTTVLVNGLTQVVHPMRIILRA